MNRFVEKEVNKYQLQWEVWLWQVMSVLKIYCARPNLKTWLRA